MKYYKFLDKPAVEKVMGGSFIFTKLSYFSLMEAVFRERGIGDISEGSAVRIVNNVRVGSEPIDPELDRRMRKAGVQVRGMQGGGSISIDNVAIHHRVECYVLSMSYGNISKLVEGTSGKKEFPYKSCIEVFDIKSLEKAFKEEGTYKNFSDMSGNPKKISDKFNNISSGLVTYKSNTATIWDDDYDSVEPYYVKDPFFSYQSEFRFVMMPCENEHPDRILVTIPNPRRFLTEVYAYEPDDKPTLTESSFTLEKLCEILKSIDLKYIEQRSQNSLFNIIKKATKVSWEARKLSCRSFLAESMLVEPDIVYGKKVDSKQVLVIVTELIKDIEKKIHSASNN